MKKGLLRCIAVIMVVLMTAVYMPVAEVADTFAVEASAATKTGSLGGNVKWTYDSKTKIITVSGTGNMKDFANGDDGQDWDSLVIWTTHYPNKHAEKIVINNGVTNIGKNAFRGLTGVKSVSIPNSVKTIGQSAFEGCSNLSSVNLTTNITSIGAYAFKGTKFASVDMPYTVTSIGSNAFSNISGLKITCFYGDVAYKYCETYGGTAVVRPIAPVVDAALDAENKQVKVTLKLKNALYLNAANLTLTYNDAVSPVSTDYTYSTDANGITTAVVHNEKGKVSVALFLENSIKMASCASDFTYTVAEFTFNINGQADKAEFTLTPGALQINELKTSAAAATDSADLHVFTDTVTKEATCNQTGVNHSECSVCSKTVDSDIPVNPNNHKGETEVKNNKDATCNDAGYTGDTVCKDCGAAVAKGNDIPATGNHDYEKAVTAPDCKNGGYTTYTCKVCGDSYVGDNVPAAGHDYDAVVTDATCTQSGYTTYTCKGCDDSYKGDFTTQLGHDFDANGECTRCDETTVVAVTFKDNTGITVDNESKVIIISKTLNAGDIKANIASGSWMVADAQGNALADDKAVATGSIIKAEKADITYLVIILGDVNSDGKVTASDARLTLRVASKMDSADETFLLAGNCDGKANITASDARLILRVGAKLQTF